jgi:phosphoglucomutase
LIIDRVVARLGREQVEVLVGSKWFVDAESFKGSEHLAKVHEAAKGLVNTVIG